MKSLTQNFFTKFFAIMAAMFTNPVLKEAVEKAKVYIPFDKIEKLFSVNKIVDTKEYFYAETTLAHKVLNVVTKKEEFFRMHFLIIKERAERKVLEADSLFKKFVIANFKNVEGLKAGYESAYTMKDADSGKVITDKLNTQKPHTIMFTTSYTELNRSQ